MLLLLERSNSRVDVTHELDGLLHDDWRRGMSTNAKLKKGEVEGKISRMKHERTLRRRCYQLIYISDHGEGQHNTLSAAQNTTMDVRQVWTSRLSAPHHWPSCSAMALVLVKHPSGKQKKLAGGLLLQTDQGNRAIPSGTYGNAVKRPSAVAQRLPMWD
jgi:hypothetical protein